jgi:hypothetical protein
MLPDPTKPPTPTEYAVIAALIAGTLMLAGIVGFVFALRAPSEKHELAAQLEFFSVVIFSVGVGVALVIWLVRKLID